MAKFNEARKISKKQKEMYVAVNAMRTYMKKEALNHSLKAFKDEGFINNTLIKWKPLKRQREQPYTRNKILTKTGALKNSLKVRANSNKNDFTVTVFSNKKYADIHNFGMYGNAWGRKRFKMPKRQFVGYSKVLDRKLQSYFNNKIKRIFA